jgi:uncharacterized protein YfdQ (DUF2303 family)
MATTPTVTELAAAGDSDIAIAADLGRRLAAERHVTGDDIRDDSLVARILTTDERIHIESFEKYGVQPRRPRGGATLHDPAAFANYADRLTDADHTSIWADQPQARVVAVFNDHADHADGGWRDHTAVLQLQPDPEWQAWIGRNGKLTGQDDFAEFVEQYAGAVINPDAATMLEVARNFTAARSVNFDQRVNLTSSDVQLTYTEDTTATTRGTKGSIEVPREFTLRLAPYLGVEPVDMIARLRWRLRDGQLGIGYQLHRPDLVAREAFARIAGSIAENTSAPLYWGTAPAAVRAE